MVDNNGPKMLTFWEHLDELRASIIKIIAVTIIFAIIAFIFKNQLFNIVFAPKSSSFVTYQALSFVVGKLNISGFEPQKFNINIINTGLASQFLIHMRVAFLAGLICASPYIIYMLFKFASPALYANERKQAVKMVSSGYILFILGVLVSYYIIFPLTVRFLGTYQVNSDVPNLISLQSYIGTFIMLCLMMGIIFEMPVLCWLLALAGILSSQFMKNYRRHAIIIILIVAAIITPTSDIITLSLVSVPMYLLFEASIVLVKKTNN